MKELQPINQNVLLELTEDNAEQKTASGIIIPDSAKSKERTGKVAGISNIENPEIAVGDTVLYKEFSGSELEFEGKNYLLIPYSDILGKVVETDSI
ncbi:MAG: chaperonin GroES [Anaerophaga sp.]|uniref:GroES family chaperonin n=1 Tax=Anaerophaga thermohalophila TaxID=177400 RepID=UPI000237D5DD|nr:co-chaperone GroES [Anaerophaga thermohalophila]MDI3521188.1 chaperonin GroES [Anaerophaga sp.]MDK2842388.1 chaperonin GroES [Anaerophaga sp.]MDN5291227.1 chaperonin GroES [Anaerophaga sp.]